MSSARTSGSGRAAKRTRSTTPIVKLTNGELFHIDRRLFTYVEADRRKYRYPVHYEDIDQMPEREQIHARCAPTATSS